MKLIPWICSICGDSKSTAAPHFIPSCNNHGGVPMLMTRAKAWTAEDYKKERGSSGS